MAWKKEFKKYINSNSKDIFNVDGHSTLIFWENCISNKKGIYTEALFLKEVKELFSRTQNIMNANSVPVKIKEYSINFPKYKYVENFKGIGYSNFKETFEYVNNKYNSYTASILVYALSKYTHSVIDKFYELYNVFFYDQNVNDYNIVNLFETMKMTTIDQIQNIIELFILKIEGEDISPEADNLFIESLINIGDNFTLHWARMFREVLLLTNESLTFDKEFTFTATQTRTNTATSWEDYDDEEFEEFFEKTRTMIFSSEYSEALRYFNLASDSSYDEFKKVYRRIAKTYHPDLNKDNKEFEIEMKKINYYKSIIEKYMM